MNAPARIERPNPRGHLCLSFDFDGPSLWIMRKMTSATPVSRGEFGAVAVPRILRLLAQRDIPSTFFIPGHTIETYPDLCKMVVDHGCEVGIHGYAHEMNGLQTLDEERAAMTRSVELVTALTGSEPIGYRAPAGDLTNQTIGLLLEHNITYDSSLMGHDYRPYRVRLGDEYPDDGPVQWGEPTDLIELPWSWTNDDYPYLEFVAFKRMIMPGLAKPDDMFDNFLGDVTWMTREVTAGVLPLVFHPQVIGRGHRLLALERFLDAATELGISYSSLADVATAVGAGAEFGIEATTGEGAR
jgi:peptidoglycan/xylan/chitin deacetylase (PgdA/CDA1 family)